MGRHFWCSAATASTLHAEFSLKFSNFHVLLFVISTHVKCDYLGHPVYILFYGKPPLTSQIHGIYFHHPSIHEMISVPEISELAVTSAADLLLLKVKTQVLIVNTANYCLDFNCSELWKHWTFLSGNGNRWIFTFRARQSKIMKEIIVKSLFYCLCCEGCY